MPSPADACPPHSAAHDDGLSVSRRGFLKVGFGFSAALACTALLPSLAGCSGAASAPQPDMAWLRRDDVAMFRALLPAIVSDLADAPPEQREAQLRNALKNIDRTCASMGEGGRAELRKLLDLLASMPLRWALTGIRTGWDSATPAQVQAFLARWRGSRFATLNAGGVVLVKLSSVAYYVTPAGWAGSGYPGPNAAVYQAIHS
nr:hypothetical protein [Cupriavidus sp. IDO]